MSNANYLGLTANKLAVIAANLEQENAELRELVHALLQCSVKDDDICAKCSYRSPLHGGCMAGIKADELWGEL